MSNQNPDTLLMSDDEPADALDHATAGRLSRLRTMPVETSSLESRLLAALPELVQHKAQATRPGRSFWMRLKPFRAVAASLLVIGVIAAVLLSSSSGPALASASEMAQMHYDLVSGKTPILAVDSIQAANRALADPSSRDAHSVPQEHVMACCMKTIKNKRVACVLLKTEGVPVTLSVANASDMKLPKDTTTIQQGGHTYHVQTSGNLNMVMGDQHGRWVCLIGELPGERLAQLASQLQF